MDLTVLLDAQRTETADFLDALEPDHWEQQSLCPSWKVRHVVGHMIGGANPAMGAFMGHLARNAFNVNKAMAASAIAHGSHGIEQLRASYRATIGGRKGPPTTGPDRWLTDAYIHAADIRRPLGMPRATNADIARAVADVVQRNRFLRVPSRVKGLRLRATDVDWTHGDGPVVEGRVESIVLAITGRRAGLEDLAGEGKATLAARV